MNIQHIDGEDKGKVFIYALSTCGWCLKTKQYLKENNIAYSFIDVDLLTGEEKTEILRQLIKFNPNKSFPTIVVNDETTIIGFDVDKIKAVLGL